MWNEEFSEGPASSTHVRIRSPVSTLMGWWAYWFQLAVEHDQVPLVVLHLGEVARLTVGTEVPLALDEDVLVVDLGQVRGIDDDRTEHAVADVVQCRGGTAVVHEDPGVLGAELVDE
jgi:hypothetical protein